LRVTTRGDRDAGEASGLRGTFFSDADYATGSSTLANWMEAFLLACATLVAVEEWPRKN